MKKLSAAFFAFVILLPGSLFAGKEWKQAIADYRAAAAPRTEKGATTPDFTGIIDAMYLRYPISHIHMKTVDQNGKTSGAADIYISDAEIYVIQQDEGWNLAVTSAGVYEWETGKKTGIKIARNNKDIAGYLLYLINPSGILTSLYTEYQAHPGDYTVTTAKDGPWKEYCPKQPVDDFEAFYATEKPLWLYGVRLKNTDGKIVNFFISAPEEMKKFPDEIKAALKQIHFEDSPLNLQRHLVFL